MQYTNIFAFLQYNLIFWYVFVSRQSMQQSLASFCRSSNRFLHLCVGTRNGFLHPLKLICFQRNILRQVIFNTYYSSVSFFLKLQSIQEENNLCKYRQKTCLFVFDLDMQIHCNEYFVDLICEKSKSIYSCGAVSVKIH